MASAVWASGGAYEAYVGRWSRRVAAEFVALLGVPGGRRWLDVGCGTGALTEAVLAAADPAGVLGVDPSDGFLDTARSRITDPRARFRSGDARSLPVPDRAFDAVVSALVLNFVPEPATAAGEIARATAPGGVAASYVWDYGDGMAMMRHFWDAATELDPDAAELDEGRRFTLCTPAGLDTLWRGAGLVDVTTASIEIPTVFAGFDDYWDPFLGGQGPAPAYLMSLPAEHRDNLRERIRSRLPIAADSSIALTARAWMVRGTASG